MRAPVKAIVDLVKNEGGVMEMEDLASHESTLVTPIKYTYGGEVTIYEVCIQWAPKRQRSQADASSAHRTAKGSLLY